MNRWVRRGAAAVALWALPACYTSKEPLDATPQLDLDPALLGAWRCLGGEPRADQEEGLTMSVERAGARGYRARIEEDGYDTPDIYEAYGSRAGGATVLNVRQLDQELKPKGDWVFARYVLVRPQVLVVEVADEAALKDVGASPAALKKAIAQRAGRSGFYQLSCVCVRARQG
jgi:hypothetical protein